MLALRLAAQSLGAAEPELRPEDLPHFPAVEPAQAIASFEVRPGFRLELAAHEPAVMDPIALSFDERGRAYVVEMRDYSERRPERLGRIRRIEDRDGDGLHESATVLVDGLPWPTAVTCWDGGVFIGSTPDILYAKDTDGDGHADLREVVFTGFASGFAPYATNQLNVQAMMNSLQWGLDCRVHGCGSMSAGKIRLVDSPFTRAWRARLAPGSENRPPAAEIDLRGRDFSFDPRSLELRAETGGGQYGMGFDDVGRKFLCSNSDHLQIARYEDRYTTRTSGYSLPSPRASIAVDGPAAEVFRRSPEEPWRVIRTRWRVTGLVQGLIEGGGRSSGYFTSATGLTVFRGDAYGPEFVGDVFVADCGSNLIHRKKVLPRGAEFVGVRPDDEQNREFIAGTDTWFRPVQFANAPDGCLWIIDMYREIIEHPWSLPPNLKRLLDLNSGNDRGRLYRVVREGTRSRRVVNLAEAPLTELLATLGHPNGWHRDTASRLLIERRDPDAEAPLHLLVRTSPLPLARLHALHVLDALGVLRVPDLASALEDRDPNVRRHGIRLVELRAAQAPSETPDLAPLARSEAHPEVLLQLAFSLGSSPTPDRATLLTEILRRTPATEGNGLITDAALSSVGQDAARVFRSLAEDADASAPSGSVAPLDNPRLAALAEMVGRRNQGSEVAMVVGMLTRSGATPATLGLTARLAEGLRRAGGSLTGLPNREELAPIQTLARATATNAAAGVAQVEAIRLLGHFPPAQVRHALQPVLGPPHSLTAQRAAVEEILRSEDAPATELLFSTWPRLAPETRAAGLELVLRRGSGPGRVLEALATERIAPRDLSAAQFTALRGLKDEELRTRAIGLLGAPSASRDDAVARLLPALNLRGDAQRGLLVHEAQCSPCHRLGGKGHLLGPDLESIRSQPKEKLLVAILDPNREVQPVYLATTVETTDEEEITGLAGPESAAAITIHQAGGIEQSIPRNQIRRIRTEGRSNMPEGFETTLEPQQLADLLSALTGIP